MSRIKYINVLLATCLMVCSLSGCAVLNMGDNLSQAIMNQDDPGVVRDGAPAYLLLIDSMIQGDPEDASMLQAGSKLYAVYAAAFVQDPERAKRLAKRARNYGQRALCLQDSDACELAGMEFEQYKSILQNMGTGDLPALYAYTISWLVWVKANSDDWNALADLPKLEAALERIIELDEAYEQGNGHLYLGVLHTIRAPAQGGKPEKGKEHFERAIALSSGRNLGAKVAYAQGYARLLYDRELHDRLLTEVVEADPVEPGLTLMNTMAQKQAQELLESADDFF